MKRDFVGGNVGLLINHRQEAGKMLYAGLDLSRHRVDVHVLDEDGRTVEVTAVRPDADALRTLVSSVARHGHDVSAVIESMTGARFVHDQLELSGWDVEIADAARVKGLAPLAAKTDKIDAWVLAELARRDLVPAIWLPDPSVRAERERARFRLHLVRLRTALKNRIHATLTSFGHSVAVSDLFGDTGRELLSRLALPEPWLTTLATSLRIVDQLSAEIDACERDLRTLGREDRAVTLLCTMPGISWVLASTIASELGDIGRFATPKKLAGYTGLCPFVRQSGNRDLRGPLAKNGPKYLRWALIEASLGASRHPQYRDRYERTKRRLGRQRGAKVARIELARDLCTAIWHMLTRDQPFAPAGPAIHLVA
jgi:transposase